MTRLNRRQVLAGAAAVGTGVVGDASRAARASTAGGAPGGDVLWNLEDDSGVERGATVVDGTVYVCALGGVLALSAADGSVQWEYDTGLSIGAPSAVGGTVYVSDYDGLVHALDAATGEPRWTFEGVGTMYRPTTVAGGAVYVGTDAGKLYAVDADDGSRLWRFEVCGDIRTAPTVVGDAVYFGSDDGHVYAVSVADGSLRWRYGTGDEVQSSPTVYDGTVYVGSSDYNVYALNAATGEQEWSTSTYGSVIASPTVHDGTVYTDGDVGELWALDAATGDREWAYDMGDWMFRSAPTVAGGAVFVGDGEGTVHAVDATDGSELWTFEATDNVWAPTVADGVVYAASSKALHALDAGVEGSSEGSRVRLGTHGHTDAWSRRAAASNWSGATPDADAAGGGIDDCGSGEGARDATTEGAAAGTGDGAATGEPEGATTEVATDDGTAGTPGPATADDAPPTDWLAGWAPLLSWLGGVTVLGPLVLGLLVAVSDRLDDEGE